MTRKIACYGWRPQLPDARDYQFRDVHMLGAAPLPPRVSLRPKMPPVFDQGQLGSCTANAAALALAFEHGGGPYSRLMIYYDERVIEGTVSQDSGGELRDVVKAMAQSGAAPEAEWPYDVARFTQKPPTKAYLDGQATKISNYSALHGREELRQCLVQGYPVIFGFSVYESFESAAVAATGVVPMPKPHESIVGGHAVTLIGYDTAIHGGDHYEVQNSWGPSWGDHGRFWMPAAYVEGPLASDFWTVRK